MPHTCHATGCIEVVRPELFMCRKHWFSLPEALRKLIRAAYRSGQCDDWRISKVYADAAREAIRYIATKEGVVPDTQVYDVLEPGNKLGDIVRGLKGQQP